MLIQRNDWTLSCMSQNISTTIGKCSLSLNSITPQISLLYYLSLIISGISMCSNDSLSIGNVVTSTFANLIMFNFVSMTILTCITSLLTTSIDLL